jgi:hypothetical protein
MDMKIKALITTLAIIGSSSVAMARPATVTATATANASFRFGTRPVATPVIRDHRVAPPVVVTPPRAVLRANAQWNGYSNAGWNDRYDDRYDDRYNQPRGLVLEEGIAFEDHEYRKDIVMGATNERFNTLRIDSDGGTTFLMKVVIEFADGGAVQQIDLNRTLRGDQGLSIDLSGSARKLHRILIYRADGGAALNMNLRHRGGFTVTAL